MSKRFAAVLAAATLACSAASASTLVAATGADAPSRPRRLDGRIGLLLGGADVGDASGFSIGISGGLGYRIGDVTLRALADYYKTGDGKDLHGRAVRAGGALRYSFANRGPDANVDVDFWGEVGAGYEHVTWLSGGVLDRPDAELAIGFEVGGRGAADRRGRRHEIGYFMALRSLIGEAPATGGMPTCAGPCTKATLPPRTDVTMFFELGVHWGR